MLLRSLLALALLGCGATAAPPDTPAAPALSFPHGVASGDPLDDRVILWTRVSGAEGPAPVRWTVYADPARSEVVERGSAEARPEHDFTVHVDAAGLAPGTTYYYAFEAGGVTSPLGRTRTAPRGPTERLRVAFFSCANYPAGFFHPYRAVARRADVDVVLHLGDYFYEYASADYGDGAALGRVPDPEGEVITLADYRRRFASYRRDPDLQEAHRQHPWVVTWDDHESANNSHEEGAENHDPATEGDWETRRAASRKAYFEWMPIRPPSGTRLYRRLRFGDLVDLFMLDGRMAGRSPQMDTDEAGWDGPERQMLGAAQERWLLEGLRASTTSWRLLGQQTVFSPAEGPEGRNTDQWDGYPAARQRLLDGLAGDAIAGVAFLTGDIHSSWAFDVPGEGYAADGSGALAVELVTPAVSSPPLANTFRRLEMDVEAIVAFMRETHPHLRWLDLEHNGYVLLDLTPEALTAEWYFTGERREAAFEERFARGFRTAPAPVHLVAVETPTATPDAPPLAP
ncbi:MAG: alkaline phosphatase D family protein [Myxococcota bacterium]